MRKRIVRFAPLQMGKVFAVLYLIVSIPIALMMLAGGALGGGESLSMLMILAIPVLYVVFGFIFMVIGALLYNLVAKWVGGIEYTTEDMGDA